MLIKNIIFKKKLQQFSLVLKLSSDDRSQRDELPNKLDIISNLVKIVELQLLFGLLRQFYIHINKIKNHTIKENIRFSCYLRLNNSFI